MKEGFIPNHGGYRKLISYRKSRIIYVATVKFCKKFISKFDRTYDQMIQAARSGKQNIIEGSQASGTSKETEIFLTGVARASLEELLEDYQDFLVNNELEEWNKEHPYSKRVYELNRIDKFSYNTFKKGVEHTDPEISTNVIIGIIRVTNYLLDRQIERLERDFMNKGGLRERMRKARKRQKR